MAIYWPWFQFVEAHGGYAALLAHQRSYVGGCLVLARSPFSPACTSHGPRGGATWLAAGGLAAGLGLSVSVAGRDAGFRQIARALVRTLGLAAFCVLTGLSWFLAFACVGCLCSRKDSLKDRSVSLVCVAWLTMSALTPIYHPYVRLWLPVEAFGWILFGGLIVEIREPNIKPVSWVLLASLLGAIATISDGWATWQSRSPGLLAPPTHCGSLRGKLCGSCPAMSLNYEFWPGPRLAFYLARAVGSP